LPPSQSPTGLPSHLKHQRQCLQLL